MDWSRGRASLAGNGAMRCAYCALRTHHADPRIHPFAKRIVGWAKARHSNPAAWAKSRARRANAARTRKAILPTYSLLHSWEMAQCAALIAPYVTEPCANSLPVIPGPERSEGARNP